MHYPEQWLVAAVGSSVLVPVSIHYENASNLLFVNLLFQQVKLNNGNKSDIITCSKENLSFLPEVLISVFTFYAIVFAKYFACLIPDNLSN